MTVFLDSIGVDQEDYSGCSRFWGERVECYSDEKLLIKKLIPFLTAKSRTLYKIRSEKRTFREIREVTGLANNSILHGLGKITSEIQLLLEYSKIHGLPEYPDNEYQKAYLNKNSYKHVASVIGIKYDDAKQIILNSDSTLIQWMLKHNLRIKRF